MNRRQCLYKIARFATQTPTTPTIKLGSKRYPTGWVYLPEHASSDRINTNAIRGSGRGKVSLLYKAYEHIVGPLVPHNQAIGDCVSHAFGLGVDILGAVQIASGSREVWKGKACTELIYGGARVEIGGGVIRFSDGAMGSWAANWLRKYGNLTRRVYTAGGTSFDLRTYSGAVARKYGKAGVPDALEPLAKQHPVRTTALIKTWDELRDAAANGYPTAVCSGQGFTDERDAEGFLKPRGSWAHAMLIIGVDDTKRPGALIQNSWGSNWVSGPTRYNQPLGSFWADAEIVERMLADEDSFALSNYLGYPRVLLPDYVLY